MDEKDMELYEKLSRLQWLMQRSRLKNHVKNGSVGDPTRGQGRVLAMLKIQPEISSKDLAYLLGIRQQSLNELLNKLEKKGYVTRVPSETDRRVMLVRLTEQGKQAQEQDSETEDVGIFDCLSSGEREQFNEYLDRMLAAFEKKYGDGMDDGAREWMRGACERMGRDQFERLMNMRMGAHSFGNHFGQGGPGFGPFGGFGRPNDPEDE
ncbi:MarR family transcriptional regulator [Eubacterium sp. 1001713B170207_170306_E7]|uniref:MarR family winged helix-turn-helix transcriptional regulator n=1 Tax=Eubacterium sp. 1001713B170207_170306_E7 TaxID=2787097 RepID=UPI00189B02FD|nr:MarR family transcriptional regulator [Eubacterium sp. 1001713B170207_170306_E7]